MNENQLVQQLQEELRSAAAHLRTSDDVMFFNDEPRVDTTHQLANLIEELADQLPADGYSTINERIWRIFAIASTWDDAQGDSIVGQRVFDLAHKLKHSSQ